VRLDGAFANRGYQPRRGEQDVEEQNRTQEEINGEEEGCGQSETEKAGGKQENARLSGRNTTNHNPFAESAAGFH
jgi:hypothetical protein